MKKLLSLLLFFPIFFGCGPTQKELDESVSKAIADVINKDSTAITSATIVSDDKSEVKINRIIQVMKPDGQGGGSIRFLIIDNHEYIQWYSDNGASMCHSSSCLNEIHTNNNQ